MDKNSTNMFRRKTRSRMYEGKMNGAKMANDRIRTRLRSSTNALRILSKSDRELNAMFPAQNRQRGIYKRAF